MDIIKALRREIFSKAWCFYLLGVMLIITASETENIILRVIIYSAAGMAINRYGYLKYSKNKS